MCAGARRAESTSPWYSLCTPHAATCASGCCRAALLEAAAPQLCHLVWLARAALCAADLKARAGGAHLLAEVAHLHPSAGPRPGQGPFKDLFAVDLLLHSPAGDQAVDLHAQGDSSGRKCQDLTVHSLEQLVGTLPGAEQVHYM